MRLGVNSTFEPTIPNAFNHSLEYSEPETPDSFGATKENITPVIPMKDLYGGQSTVDGRSAAELQKENAELRNELEMVKEHHQKALHELEYAQYIAQQQEYTNAHAGGIKWARDNHQEEIDKLHKELADAHQQWLRLKADRSRENLRYLIVIIAAFSLGPAFMLTRRR